MIEKFKVGSDVFVIRNGKAIAGKIVNLYLNSNDKITSVTISEPSSECQIGFVLDRNTMLATPDEFIKGF